MDFHYYHLAYNPFTAVPTNTVFWSRRHQFVWDHFTQAVAQYQGFVILIGTTGLGKTTLLNTYQAQTDPASIRIITDLDASQPYPDLVRHLAQASHINDRPTNNTHLARALQTRLLTEHTQGLNTVVLIDDAHVLSTESLQNLQQLSEQTTTPSGCSLQFVLAGRPALAQRCNRSELRPLVDRAGLMLTLEPLSPEESAAYVQHHLDSAAAKSLKPIFTKGALKLIIAYAQGIPKAINIMSTDVLVIGLLRGERPITTKTAREAIGDVSDTRTLFPFLRWGLIGAVSLVLLVGLWSVLTPGPELEIPQVASSPAQNLIDTTQAQPPLTQLSPSQPPSETLISSRTPQTPNPKLSNPTAQPTTDQPIAEISAPAAVSLTTHSSAQTVVPDSASDTALSNGAPTTPITPIPPTAETSLPIEVTPADGVLHATLYRIEPPRNLIPSPPSSTIPSITKPLTSQLEPENLNSPRMVCVMPRAGGKRGSDIVLIDDNHTNGNNQSGIQQLVSDGLQNMSPALSPDGKLLAYTSYRDGTPNIYLLNLSTKQETQLTSGPWLALPGDWSSNGRYLALSQSLDGNNDIFLYDVQRRRLRRLTTHRGLDVSPSFAPDSHRIVFASDRTGSPQLYLTDVTAPSPTRLTQTGPYNTSPAWSPGSNSIAFIGRGSDRSLDLYLIQASGKGLKRLTQGKRFHAPPTWAPSGDLLMGIGLRGSTWERHLIHLSETPNTTQLPQTGPLCLAPQWVAQHIP